MDIVDFSCSPGCSQMPLHEMHKVLQGQLASILKNAYEQRCISKCIEMGKAVVAVVLNVRLRILVNGGQMVNESENC